MKVAFSTSTGIMIDESFRKAKSFTVWDIAPQESYYVNSIFFDDDAGTEEARLTARAEALAHCAILCSPSINGPAAAKLVARNIHPMRTVTNTSVEEIIGKLQQALQENPPPWMRKAQDSI